MYGVYLLCAVSTCARTLLVLCGLLVVSICGDFLVFVCV